MYNESQKSNTLQVILGVFSHGAGSPTTMTRLLNRMALCVAPTSVDRAISSLSAKQRERIRKLRQEDACRARVRQC
jgi:hypothetical protein